MKLNELTIENIEENDDVKKNRTYYLNKKFRRGRWFILDLIHLNPDVKKHQRIFVFK